MATLPVATPVATMPVATAASPMQFPNGQAMQLPNPPLLDSQASYIQLLLRLTHMDLAKRIDPNAQAQKASEAASAAQAAAAQAAAAAELTVAAKPLLDKLDAMESRLKAIESKQGSCCVVS